MSFSSRKKFVYSSAFGFLILIMMMPFFSNGKENPKRSEISKIFKAGAAIRNINPKIGSSVKGGFQDRTAMTIHDEMSARELVFGNGQHLLGMAAMEIGLELEEKIPFETSFTIALANGYNSYLPTPEHHQLGSYETWLSSSSYLEVGYSEDITEVLCELLGELDTDRHEPLPLRDQEKSDGFEILFDGSNLDKWRGNTIDYVVEDDVVVIYPDRGGKGDLFTKKEFSDFIFRFEFQLTSGANNGLGIRAPLEGVAAFEGIELQIIDNTAEIYKNIEDYQYHGSVYGVIPAKQGYLKPVGEWNYQEVIVKGPNIKVILNGTVILDGNIDEASKNGTLDGKEHPGLKRKKGHIGFLGHGDVVRFKNIRVKDLSRNQ